MFDNIFKNRERTYWSLQLFGWGGYVLLLYIINLIYEGFLWKRALLFIFIFVSSVAFTHIYRGVIKNRKWLNLQLKEIFPRVLFSSFFISLVLVSMFFMIIFTTQMYELSRFKIASPIANIFHFTVIFLGWTLAYFSFHYFENYRRSEIERLVWEAAVKDFELKTLKSQLNPHFMFNALNSIRALVEENPELAKVAINHLSNIFRYSLRIELTETVPLEEEMKVVADYLALEKIRYEERLYYFLSVEEEVKKVEIPPMMIQTLVENGIKHGVSKIPAGGKIEVKAFVEKENLKLQMINSGLITEEEILNAKGYGIKNTKQRLDLLYGNRAQFEIKNFNREVLAEIILPLKGRNQ